MDDERTEVTETVAQGNGVTTRQRTASSKATSGYKFEQVIWLVAGVLEALLALRFVLALLGANIGNAFAHFIFSLTYPFVAPFFGLFGYTFQYGVSHLEIETIVAMLVYAAVAWGITKLVNIVRA